MNCWSSLFRLVVRIEHQFFCIEQQLQHIGVMLGDWIGRLQNKRHFLACRDICFTPEIATLSHQSVLGINDFKIAMIQPVMTAKVFIKRFWPAREHDGFGTLIIGHIGVVPHAMPELLSNKWQEWMEKKKRIGKHEINYRQSIGAAP